MQTSKKNCINIKVIQREYLEYYLNYHCNLKCANCSVGSPFIDPTFNTDFDSYCRDIDNLGKYMRVNALRMLGGEPTLHPDIVKYMKYAKESDLVRWGVAVATNGIGLKRMPDEFWDHVGICNISEYKNSGINYEKLYQWLDDNNLRYNRVHELENSETAQRIRKKLGDDWMDNNRVPEWHFLELDLYEESPPDIAQEVYTHCPKKDICHTFLNGKYYKCGFSTHRNIQYKAMGVTIPYDIRELDGIPIDETFPHQYHEHCNSKEININACRWCRGYGKDGPYKQNWLPHRQLSKIEIREIKT